MNKISDDYYGAPSDLLETATQSSYRKLWCGIGNFEVGVLTSYFIFIILFFGFEIVCLLIHKNIIKLKIEGEGKLYYIIVGINILFLVIFYTFLPFLLYLFVYSMIVILSYPDTPNSKSETGSEKNINEQARDEKKTVPAINTLFVFFILVCDGVLIQMKKAIIFYLNMRYDNENINIYNEKTKKKTLRINNNDIELEIKANQITYLERVGQKGKIYKFKKIKIKGVTNDFIYINLNNKAIDDQLSITDWKFPLFNELYLKLVKMAYYIYGVLFISIPLFKFHLINDVNYNLTSNTFIGISEKPKFYSIYSSYGSFELGTTTSRFILYVIALFFTLLSIGKRIFYGGYTRPIMILICFIANAIFTLVNIIYVILSFLMSLFSVFSIVCFNLLFQNASNPNEIIKGKLFVQMIINFIIFLICISLLIFSIRLITIINILRKDINHLNDGTEPEEQEKIKQFQYQGLDNRIHLLNEMRIEGHPKYIYYNLYGDINDVPQPQPAKNIDNENNNNENNSINIPLQHSINKKEIQNNQTIQNNISNTGTGDLSTLS